MEKLNISEIDLQRFKRTPLRLEVYKYLKDSIIQGRFKPGDRLNEIELGQQFGISRTPVRETLLSLENAGLVTIDPGKGAVVTKISKVDLDQIYPIVAVLEGLAARLATFNLTRSDLAKMRKYNKEMKAAAGQVSRYMKLNLLFHQTFLQNCHNERLLETLLNLKDQIYRFRLFSLAMPNRTAQSSAEHDLIVQALENKEAFEVERLVKEHVLQGKKAIEEASIE